MLAFSEITVDTAAAEFCFEGSALVYSYAFEIENEIKILIFCKRYDSSHLARPIASLYHQQTRAVTISQLPLNCTTMTGDWIVPPLFNCIWCPLASMWVLPLLLWSLYYLCAKRGSILSEICQKASSCLYCNAFEYCYIFDLHLMYCDDVSNIMCIYDPAHGILNCFRLIICKWTNSVGPCFITVYLLSWCVWCLNISRVGSAATE